MLSKNSVLVLRIGLACAFLSQALVAYFAPDEFQGIIEASFLVKVLPMITSGTFVTLILINDSILSLIFFLNLKMIKYALLWASIWMIIVMVVVGEPIDAIEHVSFLAMSLALFINLRNKS